MPESDVPSSDRARAKPQQESRQRVSSADQGQTSAGPSAGMQEPQYLGESLLGSDFSQSTFERHASLLGDSRLSHPANARVRMQIAQRLQRDYGNQYVQRLVKHNARASADASAEDSSPVSTARTEGRKGVASDAKTQQETKQTQEQEVGYSVRSGQGKELLNSVGPTSRGDLVQRSDEEREGSTSEWFEWFNLSGVEIVRGNMSRRFHQTNSYASRGVRAADTVRSKLLAISEQYEGAYNNYATVIRAGRAAAQDNEQMLNICLGIAAGALIGLGVTYILATGPTLAWNLTMKGAIGAFGSALGQAGAGAAITTGMTDLLSVSGTDLEPGGFAPAVLNSSIWKNVAELYRGAVSLSETAGNLHMLTNAAEYLIGEIRVHVAGGETRMSEDNVLDLMGDLVRTDKSMVDYDSMLSQKLEALALLQETADSMSLSDYSQREMEQDIWILWIAGLSDPSVLDPDAIEDYLHGSIGVLGPGSRLNVDFGRLTTSADEKEARDAALGKANEIRARVSSLGGANL